MGRIGGFELRRRKEVARCSLGRSIGPLWPYGRRVVRSERSASVIA